MNECLYCGTMDHFEDYAEDLKKQDRIIKGMEKINSEQADYIKYLQDEFFDMAFISKNIKTQKEYLK